MQPRTARWIAIGIGVLVIAELLILGLWDHIDDNTPAPGFEQQLAVVAALMLLTLPHVIAYRGYRGRPALLTVAGVVAVALTFASAISPGTLILAVPLLLVPGIVYLVRSNKPGPRTRVPTGILAIFAVVGAIAAAGSLFLTQDPRCSITVERDGRLVHENVNPCDPTSTGRLGPEVVQWSGTSDTVAWHESLLSLVLSVGTIALCVRGASPKDESALEPIDLRARTDP